MINPEYNQSFWYFDQNGMILERLGWGSDGKGDSVGRNAFAYICWPNLSYLKDTMLQCVKVRDDSYVQFYRYPGEGADTISRDHIGSIILALFINRDRAELKFILENLPWRVSRKYTQTLDFWLWQKTLLCELNGSWVKWIASTLFYLLTFLMFIVVIPWNSTIRYILGIKKAGDLKFEPFVKGTWKHRLSKTIYPHFALFLLAWQIKVCPPSPLKWLIQNLLLLESNNIVIDATLGKKIPEERYLSFIPLTSFIWSRRMDTSDDIMIRKMTDAESRYNDLNRGMLDYLYFGLDRIMLSYHDLIIEAIKKNDPIIRY